MADPIAFTFSGVPVAKGRPRALARVVKMGGIVRAVVQLITPPETRKAEAALQKLGRAIMGPRRPFAGPVRLTVIAVYEMPPSWPKSVLAAASAGVIFHTSKPDADNLAKLVGDALNEITYQDDSQVAELIVRKRYGAPARTEIEVRELISIVATPADKRRTVVEKSPPASPADASPRLL